LADYSLINIFSSIASYNSMSYSFMLIIPFWCNYGLTILPLSFNHWTSYYNPALSIIQSAFQLQFMVPFLLVIIQCNGLSSSIYGLFNMQFNRSNNLMYSMLLICIFIII
jgi:hypothetical protein